MKNATWNIWLSISMFLLAMASTATGQTIYVDDDASVGGNGQTWGTAYKYLQDALDVASSGDMILVAEGVYKPDEDTAHPDGTGNRSATFQLKNGVAIYGGFPPGGGNWEDRDPNDPNNETILSGDLNGDDGPDFANNNENSYHIIIGSWTDSTAILDGFTITAGKAAGKADNGGGMYNDSGSPTLTNCTFSGNSAEQAGGGVYNTYEGHYYTSPTLTNCAFSGNSADYGGGMYNSYSSNSNIINCTFTGNIAEFYGGGMSISGNSNIINCTFSYNSADSGGGLFNYYGSPMILNCKINDNKSWESGGGGIYCENSSPTIANCTISGNNAVAWSGGGGIYCENSSPTIANCTISDNKAVEWSGGGIYCEGSSPTIANCTISDNKADFWCGGGIYCDYQSDPNITNCLISYNTSRHGGGGIYCDHQSNPNINNCIISYNFTTDTGGGIKCDESDANIINCTISGNSAEVDGGGISCSEGNLNITNCIMSGNAGGLWGARSGAVFCRSSNLILTNCTITDNIGWEASAILCIYSTLNITNCILWGNEPSYVSKAETIHLLFESNASIGYTALQGGQDDVYIRPGSTLNWGEGNIDADPCFVEPGFWDPNGTPGGGRSASDDFWVEGNYHLLRTSPCIDAGDNTAVPLDTTDLDGDSNTAEPIPFDLDGNPRIMDGNNDGNPVVDMGAFEVPCLYELVEGAIAEKEEALQKINAALEKELEAYEILEQMLESGDYGDWNREAILGARWNISIAIFYEEDYIKKVLEKNIDKLQRTLSVLGVETNGGSYGNIPVPSVGAYNPAALSLHQLVINLIEEALTEKAEALERIDAALQKERQAYELLEQMLINRDYGDWNRRDVLRAKSRIYVAIKYEEYLKKVLMIMTVDKLEDSLSRLAAQASQAATEN